MKKIIYCTLAFTGISMLLAVPWHLMIFKDAYHTLTPFMRADPIIPLGMLSIIIQGAVLGYLYPMYYAKKGGNPIQAGITFTLIAGLLIYTVMGLTTVAKYEVTDSGQFLLLHTGFQLIQFIISGAAIGLIYGRQPKTT